MTHGTLIKAHIMVSIRVVVNVLKQIKQIQKVLDVWPEHVTQQQICQKVRGDQHHVYTLHAVVKF